MRRSVPVFLASLVAAAIIGGAIAVRGSTMTMAPLEVPVERATSPKPIADPSDFGLSVPSPEPALPNGSDPFSPPGFGVTPSSPAIAESSKSANRSEIVSMTGVDLDGASAFKVFAQAPSAVKGEITDVTPLRADKTAATLLLPSSLPEGSMYLIWPYRGDKVGQPVAVNRTDAWWIGPSRAAVGSVISVYGRNLSRDNGTSLSYLYIKPPGASGQYVTPVAVNPFKVDFSVPDLAAGIYEVWIHNSHGGRFGWSGPLTLNILAHSQWADQDKTNFDVKRFGAVGDGTTDDTAAIKKALKAAGDAAPATVYFPKGTYIVSASLTAPDNVGWTGEGMDSTEIRLGRPIKDALIKGSASNARFEKLTLNADHKAGTDAVMDVRAAKDLQIQSARINAWGGPALEADKVNGLYISNSELVENGSFYGSGSQIFLTKNTLKMTGDGESAVALWGGRDFSMIGNALVNADESREDGNGIGRFFVGQAHFGSMRNLYFGKNSSLNAAPRDCRKVDCNKGEQICLEVAGSKVKADIISASENTVTFKSLADLRADLPSGLDLVVIGGRGAGQHRHIVGTGGSTVKLDRAWNVVPDTSSRFALAAIASNIAVYDNSFEGRASYSEHDSDSTSVLLYGNVYDAVIDHNRISKMRHGMMSIALDSTRGLVPYFLQYSNNVVSNSNSGLYVGTTFADSGIAGIWGGLGNIYRNNRFENMSHIGVEYETWAHDGSDFNGTVFERNSFKGVRYGFVDAYQLMWTYDGRFKSAPQRHSVKVNTILHDNDFDRGTAPSNGSAGFISLNPTNTWLNIGSSWTGFATGNSGPPMTKPLPD